MDVRSFNPGQNFGGGQGGPTWQMSKLRLREVVTGHLRSRWARLPAPVVPPAAMLSLGTVHGLPGARPASGDT